MNNRWIYGLELLVFGAIAMRGGWVAFRAQAVWARTLGVLALLAAAVTGALLVTFALNVAIPPVLHSSALVGALLVVAHQTLRVAQTVPGNGALLIGLYGALAFVLPRSAPPPRPPGDEEDLDDLEAEDKEPDA
jgi:hypothetical protein